MRSRIDLLSSGKYGDELVARSDPFIPIFNRFVATFEHPDDEDLKTSWLNVAHATSAEMRTDRHLFGLDYWFCLFSDGRRNHWAVHVFHAGIV
jgi:hypothetical protein